MYSQINEGVEGIKRHVDEHREHEGCHEPPGMVASGQPQLGGHHHHEHVEQDRAVAPNTLTYALVSTVPLYTIIFILLKA